MSQRMGINTVQQKNPLIGQGLSYERGDFAIRHPCGNTCPLG